MIIHSDFQITPARNKKLDVLLHTPMMGRSESEHALFYYLLKHIGFTVYTLFGVKLFPYQEVILTILLRRPYVINLLSRGGSKTFLNGIYAPLKAIVSPGIKLLGVGSNRRQSRFIYQVIMSIINNKNSALFREVCKKYADQPEESFVEICGGGEKTSRLSFTPIANGDRIRGFRANVLCVDEANIVSEDIFNNILQPMIAVGLNPYERVQKLAKEKELIEAGIIKQEDSIEMDTNQIILSSSAGYSFTFLYKQYEDYKKIILDGIESEDPVVKRNAQKYAIIQMSYEAINQLSPGALNMNSILAAKRTMSSDRFLTEYCAQFATDSNGFIPRSLLESRQIPMSKTPMVEAVGNSDDTYILAIDPSSGENEKNDYFAIVVIKLNVVTRICTCMNAAASTGKGWPHYVELVKEYIKKFRPKYIIIDSYGGGTQVASLLKDSKYVDQAKGEILLKEVDGNDLKKSYCHAENRILRMNVPTNQFNEQSNMHFKSSLEHEQFWFAAPIGESKYTEKYVNMETQIKKIDEFEEISATIEEAKGQIALIVPKQGNHGLTTFGMPDGATTGKKKDRVRKDLYSAMLLGAWGAKEYLEILSDGSDNGPKPYFPVITIS